MTAPLVDTTYYIGQGQAYWAPRTPNGPLIGGFNYFGDVSALKISSKQKTVEVEENTTGFGTVALHAPVSIPLDVSITLPIWSMQNLALALFGSASGTNSGGTVASEATNAYPGVSQYLANFGLTSALTLATATGIVTGTTVGTPGSGYTTAPTVAFSAAPAGGVTATGVAIVSGGAVTAIQITNPGKGYTAAPTITFSGGGGTSAAATASITPVTLVAGTDFTLSAQFGMYTALASTFFGNFATGTAVPLTAGYSYQANNGSVSILTAPSPEIALRFNGLNVAQPNGQTFGSFPVYIKRAKLDFAKTISLIDKKNGTLDLDGAWLYDSTATDGNPFGLFYKA